MSKSIFKGKPRRGSKGAFTLIELLVVLAIAALITSITLGGFKEMTQGNKRVSCQTNLVQIYQACRLYAADEGSFPFYGNSTTSNKEVDCGAMGTSAGIGLWSLYTFPNGNNLPTLGGPLQTPLNRYIRSAKVFHCPNHLEHRSMYTDTGRTTIDEFYLSYQYCDDGSKNPTTPFISGEPTYSSRRPVDETDTALWPRQLMHYKANGNFVRRLPADNTIVTYCPFHRNSRDMDNVLFYDGSVQTLPRQKDAATGWERTPKDLS